MGSTGFYDYLAIGTLVLAILVNTLTVYSHRRWGIYARFGQRAWAVHQLVLTMFWGLAVAAGFLLQRSEFVLERQYPVFGGLIMIAAIVLFAAAIKQIGAQGLGNGNFFGQPVRKLRGVYLWMENPIYISYVMWYAGLMAATAHITFGIMSLISVIGLLGIESKIESINNRP